MSPSATVSAPASMTVGHRFMLHARVIDRLLRSDLFLSYKDIFVAATGLPLELRAVDDDELSFFFESANRNRFCQMLNGGKNGCKHCLAAQRCLATPENHGVHSITCFAGIRETAVPVEIGSVVIAHLKTGQVVHSRPDNAGFRKVVDLLDDVEVDVSDLEEAFFAVPVVDKRRYRAAVTLLAAFSLQLSLLANRIALELESEEEDLISLIKEYIEEHLSEPIHLNEVARQTNISTFHFCRKFKEATDMTLTSYVTQRRVELAKEALKTTDRKVTEIAFEVGFQSLSRFNRSFRMITGTNPTQYRRISAS